MFVKRDLVSQVGGVDHRLEVLGYAGETRFQALARQRSQRAEARPYDHLIVNWGGHISHAAFAIEQKNRAEAEFGPLQSSLGFHPFKLECLPAPFAKREAYSNNYYWQQYVSLPQFDDLANRNALFRVLVKTRAAWTTCRVLVIAALAALVSRRRRHFFLSIKKQKVRDLTIGAQVLSHFLRDGAVSRGYLELNSSFIRNLYECYLVAYYWLDVSPGIDFKKILFSNPETTYRNEIARRALLKRGATEILSDRWKKGRFTLANSHKFGYELALCPLSVQTAATIELARTELMSRLAGASKYVYMAEDVEFEIYRPATT